MIKVVIMFAAPFFYSNNALRLDSPSMKLVQGLKVQKKPFLKKGSFRNGLKQKHSRLCFGAVIGWK